jgi:hypothetical protein
MTPRPRPSVEVLRFLGWAVIVAVVSALLGYAPTLRLGGAGALPAMFAGCAIGLVASAVGALPAALSRRKVQAAPLQGMLAAMGLRLATVVVLGVSVGLSGWFESRALLIWIALGYIGQLALDTRYAIRGF